MRWGCRFCAGSRFAYSVVVGCVSCRLSVENRFASVAFGVVGVVVYTFSRLETGLGVLQISVVVEEEVKFSQCDCWIAFLFGEMCACICWLS